MNGKDLRGVTVATVMPFHEDGSIDWDSYRRALDHALAPAGVQAVFVNGHAGEAAALTPDERVAVIERTRAHVGAGRPLLAGIVAYSTAEAIARTREAQAGGADVAVFFPFPQFGAGGGADHRAAPGAIAAIHDAVPMPVSIFQYPLASGAGFTTQVLSDIVRHPGVIAIKEGSGDIGAYEDNLRVVRAIRPDVAMLPSNFSWFMPQLAVGGDGILSGLASLIPAELAELWHASEANDLPAMRRAADKLYPVIRTIYGAPPLMDMHTRIKAAMAELGIIANPKPRAPLQPLSPEVDARCRAMVRSERLAANAA